jgi:hypothetical protein
MAIKRKQIKARSPQPKNQSSPEAQPMKARSLRQATRRFEMSVHDGVPESPQPMYQESTYGKIPARLTGQSSSAQTSRASGEVAATFLLREGEVIVVKPTGQPKPLSQKCAKATGEDGIVPKVC